MSHTALHPTCVLAVSGGVGGGGMGSDMNIGPEAPAARGGSSPLQMPRSGVRGGGMGADPEGAQHSGYAQAQYDAWQI